MVGIKIPTWLWAGALAVAAFIGYSWLLYNNGKDSVQDEWDASIARGRVIVEELKKQQVQVTTKVETVYVDRIKTVYEKGDTIYEQVPVYIEVGVPDLPGGFRLLHDAAATNTIPSPAGIPDAKPVPVRDAAGTISRNYTTCNAAIEELQGMRAWAWEQYQLSQEAIENAE